MKFICAQLGARQNYEIPLHFCQTQRLSLLLTDFWNPFGDKVKTDGNWLPGAVRRAQARFRPGIPWAKVRTAPKVAFDLIRFQNCGTEGGELFSQLSTNFANLIAKYADRIEHDSLYAFCGAALEGIERERDLGHFSVLDQYDTGPELEETIESEALRFKSLKQQMTKLPTWYYERLREEWRLVDRIIVNSSWTRQSLMRSGVPKEKIAIVPLCAPKRLLKADRGRRGSCNLRVLWLGRLCLGKGLAYAIEAARLARKLPIDFTFVGPSLVDKQAIVWPENSTVQGSVDRGKVDGIYASHDVFLFPTLSDGFGRVQLEAMAYGLPVIATPCCGDVVEHAKSGFIVPPRDAHSIVDALEALLDRDRLDAMSAAAYARAEEFSDERVSALLDRALIFDRRLL